MGSTVKECFGGGEAGKESYGPIPHHPQWGVIPTPGSNMGRFQRVETGPRRPGSPGHLPGPWVGPGAFRAHSGVQGGPGDSIS